MSPGANKRQTGTVPKTKTSRKNSVPQEMVAPTRRDLQQHLNVSKGTFWFEASLSFTKPTDDIYRLASCAPRLIKHSVRMLSQSKTIEPFWCSRTGCCFMMHSASEQNVCGRHFNLVALLQQLLSYVELFATNLSNIIFIPFKDFFASVQRASKRDNNRTPGEGTCFDIGMNTSVLLTILWYFRGLLLSGHFFLSLFAISVVYRSIF